MKKIALIACALLLVGCGTSSPGDAESNSSPSPSAPEQTTTTAPAPFSASETQNCIDLTAAEDGLIVRADDFLVEFEDLNDDTAAEAQTIVDALEDAVDATQSRRQQDLLEVVQEPFRKLVADHEDGNPWEIRTERYWQAGEELITSCFPLLVKAQATPTPTKTTTPATPRPTPSVTSPAAASPRATQAPSQRPATFTYDCKVDGVSGTKFTSYEEAWASGGVVELCTATKTGGTYSDKEEEAASAAYKSGDPDSVRFLYELCARTGGHYVESSVSDSQGREIEAALTLCPDHPKADQMRANATAALTDAADREAGKLVGPGSYLVGTEIVPGTWQSYDEKVENCYWETSDAQGNIIENNFISIAPQFTLYIPPTAAGFTAKGCFFRWISD